MSNRTIEYSFENLAQSLRILSEAIHKAHRMGLIFEDHAEAIGNIENAYTSILNGFHSLYDAIGKELPQKPIDWYKTPELATILVLRNARHHNLANKIRTIYSYLFDEERRIKPMEEYVLVDFPIRETDDGGNTMSLYISWKDFNILLSQNKSISRINEETISIINAYLNTKLFFEYEKNYKLPQSKVFLNVVPLFVNAGKKIMPFIKRYCNYDSIESTLFRELFLYDQYADTQNHEVNCEPFVI